MARIVISVPDAQYDPRRLEIVLCAALAEYRAHRAAGDAWRYVDERYPYMTPEEKAVKRAEVSGNLSIAGMVRNAVASRALRIETDEGNPMPFYPPAG